MSQDTRYWKCESCNQVIKDYVPTSWLVFDDGVTIPECRECCRQSLDKWAEEQEENRITYEEWKKMKQNE